MTDVQGFVPNVRCPHCRNPIRQQFTGFGRTGLNVRQYECGNCGRSFRTVLYVFTTTEKEYMPDAELSDIKRNMRNLRRKLERLKAKHDTLMDWDKLGENFRTIARN